MKNPNYFVEIRKVGTDEVIKRMGPHDEQSAERIERGVLINMNRDDFYTELVPVDDNE